MTKSKAFGLLAILVGISAIGFQLWKSIEAPSSGSLGYASFTQAALQPGKEFHVVGTCDRKRPMRYNPKVNPDLFSFFLTDQNGTQRQVNLHKSKPQDFDKSEQIVLIGTLQDSVFEASDILLKCPSKYNETTSR